MQTFDDIDVMSDNLETTSSESDSSDSQLDTLSAFGDFVFGSKSETERQIGSSYRDKLKPSNLLTDGPFTLELPNAVWLTQQRDFKNISQLYSDVAAININNAKAACCIGMSSITADTLGIFRALMKANELSIRSLLLSALVIAYNESDYSVWVFRRRCIVRLFNSSRHFSKELAFTRHWLKKSPKNYQLWHHRRWILSNSIRYFDEFRSVEKLLEKDAKNMHVWKYRYWLANKFQKSLTDELSFTESFIEKDCRNHSVWSYRHSVVENYELALDNDSRHREIMFVIKWIKIAPHNESPWTYLFSFFQDPFSSLKTPTGTAEWCDAPDYVIEVIENLLEEHPFCRFNLQARMMWLVSCHRHREALLIIEQLRDCADTIRSQFWSFRRKMIEAKI